MAARTLIICLLALVSLSGAAEGRGQGPGGGGAAATPTPPAPPAVELQVTPIRDNVGRGEPLTLYISVINKSNAGVTVVRVVPPDEVFVEDERAEQARPLSTPRRLDPYRRLEARMVVRARDSARYAQYKFPVAVDYTWAGEGGKTHDSTLSATVTLDLKRRFEEEAKGFPGGTAAFLYLLLPIVPALLTYQVVEALRKKEGLKAPAFKSEHIAPAFMLAVVVSLLFLTTADEDSGLDYSDPKVFLAVVALSAAAGAFVPAARWGWAKLKMFEWGFRSDDPLPDYLRKALLGPGAREQIRWVQGKADGELWEGLLLRQPDRTKVLGIQLAVSPGYGENDDQAARDRAWNDLITELVRADGTVVNAEELVRKAEGGEVSLRPRAFLRRGGRQLNTGVVAWELGGLVELEGRSQASQLLTPVR